MVKDELFHVIEPAPFKLVDVRVKVPAIPPLESNKRYIRVVLDVGHAIVHVTARQAEDEVHTVVVFPDRHVLVVHLLSRIVNLVRREGVLVFRKNGVNTAEEIACQ